MEIETLPRTFLTCKSKNCVRSSHSKTRCTLSFTLITANGKTIARDLNRRNFCVMESDVPNWTDSPDKPGRKKLREKANENTDLDLLDLIGETGLEIT